jgi:hypothetical protein
MSLQVLPTLVFHVQDLPQLDCMTCGHRMTHEHTEPISNNFEMRGFFCEECDIKEAFIIDLTSRLRQ